MLRSGRYSAWWISICPLTSEVAFSTSSAVIPRDQPIMKTTAKKPTARPRAVSTVRRGFRPMLRQPMRGQGRSRIGGYRPRCRVRREKNEVSRSTSNSSSS